MSGSSTIYLKMQIVKSALNRTNTLQIKSRLLSTRLRQPMLLSELESKILDTCPYLNDEDIMGLRGHGPSSGGLRRSKCLLFPSSSLSFPPTVGRQAFALLVCSNRVSSWSLNSWRIISISTNWVTDGRKEEMREIFIWLHLQKPVRLLLCVEASQSTVSLNF